MGGPAGRANSRGQSNTMIFTPTRIKDAFVIDLERVEDERGFFARSWCASEFEQHGLDANLAQTSISFNKQKGTLRGMHYQVAPHEEAKLVRCTQGAAYDVIIDLRPESPSFKRWYSVELTADNGKSLYVPKGLAHGFQTLTDETTLFYQISTSYHPESARGLRFDDPAFGVEWPAIEPTISAKDRMNSSFQAD